MNMLNLVVQHTKADLVGDQYLARIDNQNVIIGERINGQGVLNMEGLAIAATLEKKTRGRPAKAEPTEDAGE